MDQEQQLHDASTSSSRMRMKMKKKSIKQLDKKINNNSKRRFSDEQIRSLETIFESQSKLEPRKKVQLARDLELHPRQVAIWFQNKRARYKSKQLETDFNILRARYNSLASSFEVLKSEKQALANQKLQSELQMEKREAGQSCKHLNSGGLSFDDDEEEEEEYIIGLDEDEPTSLINMVESGDGGSVSCSGEKWGRLGTDCFFDESGSSYQWWDCLP